MPTNKILLQRLKNQNANTYVGRPGEVTIDVAGDKLLKIHNGTTPGGVNLTVSAVATPATTTNLGSIKVGANLTITEDGTLNAENGDLALGAVAASIIPATDNTYDLGSPTKRWRHVYAADGSMYIGDIKLSNDNGRLLVQQVTDAGLITEAAVPNTPGSVTTDRIVNGELAVVLDSQGSLTVPSPQSRTFPLTFGSSNYVSNQGKPTLTLTGDTWAITGGLVYGPDGNYSLVLESFVPSLTNPGYDTGDTFTFDSTVHGLVGYTLSLTLTNVAEIPGQGWTSDIAATQLPAYPSTIKSNGAVKVTADAKSWTFGTDGKLTLPAGGDIVNSSGTSVLGGGGNANTGDITFSNNIIRNTSSLGGEVNLETASQQGDPNKAWSFNHDGAGSLYVPTGSSIKSELGLSIVATDTGFANFTNVRDFDTNSYLDFDYISIVNPSADILDKINPSSPNYAAGVGATVRFVYANYLVQEAVITEGFAVNSDDPFTGLPRYTGRINFNSTTMQDLIKEISFNNSANWRFTPGGKLYLPLDGEIIGAHSTDLNFPNGLIRLVPNEKDFPGGPDGYTTFGQYIDIYPTNQFDTPHIHIAAGKGEGGTGSLVLGDDQQNIEVRNDGSISIQSYDQLRGSINYWYFNTNGVLQGPGMGTVGVQALSGAPGSDLYLTPGGVDRFTSEIQFADADGSLKSVFTVDTNTFYIGNIPPIGGASLWYQNGSPVAITSIIVGSGTATFNLGDPVSLNPNTTYTVEWPGTNTYDVRVQTDSGDWSFKNDGSFSNRGSFTRTTTPAVNSLQTSAVVWTGLFDYISGAKLTIQLETDEVGDATGWHSQMCEAIIASRGYANSAAGPLGDPIMTVYGVTYTSTVPLATFTVQRNPTTKLIEVVATRTAATTDSIAFRIYSVETSTRD